MNKPNHDIFIVDTIQGIEDLLRVLNSAPGYLCLDLETDNVSEKKANIHGIGLCVNTREAFYIPVRNKEKQLLWNENELNYIFEAISEQARSRGIIGWNLIYDVLVWEYNSGIDISSAIYSDGILMKHTLYEERPHGLKECAVKFLGDWADKAQKDLYDNIEKNGGSTTKENTEMWKADEAVLAEYCGWDVLLSYFLFDLFTPQLKEQGLEKFFYEEEVMPLYQVTISMKRQGFPIDVGYFEKLHADISKEIKSLEGYILEEIADKIAPYVERLLNEEFPCKRTGNFPKALAKILSLDLPEKDGKITLSKKEINKFIGTHWFYSWLLGDDYQQPTSENILDAQEWLYRDKYNTKDVFNLSSNMHLGWLFFESLKLKPLSKTEGGKPQCDDEFLDSIRDKYPFVEKLIDYKKLQKLDSTYIQGVLERHIDGVLYSSFLQFGTTSGRYSSTNPNLQNLPRVKDEEAELSPIVLKYVNSIKRGFIAPDGYKIVNADYSQLEPCCFAHASGDEKLREVFRKGYDLYSQIAIDVFGLQDCSADKKAKNYLKKLHPEKRQLVKVFCLAVVYGAQSGRISEVMGVDKKYAEEVIEAYLNAYPGLKSYIKSCHEQAKAKGFVKNEFGRIRHLPIAKALYTRWGDDLLDPWYASKHGAKDLRYTFKNNLNNACNFPIQSTAASIVNRSMIATYREFKKRGLDAYLVAQVHDENCCIVREDQVEEARKILKNCMENTVKISVPLSTDPLIGDNWAEAK